MSKSFVEYKTARGNRIISTRITTPLLHTGGVKDSAVQRWFRVVTFGSFLDDLRDATGIDATAVAEREDVTLRVGDFQVTLQYIADLVSVPGVPDRDGTAWETPPVSEGPHVNLIALGNAARFFSGVDAWFMTNGVRETRTIGVTDGTKSTRSVGK